MFVRLYLGNGASMGGLKTRDQIAGVEKTGLENTGTSYAWVAKCNIINVRGHERVNVTAGRGDPHTLQVATVSFSSVATFDV